MLFHPAVDFRSKTCCLTGHQDIAPWEEKKVLNKMWIQVARLLQEGYLYFGVGGARGFDRLAAEYLLDIRDQWKKQIRIISVLPYPGYMKDWDEQDIARQERIIRRSNKVVYVCQEKDGAFLARDRKLVDESSFCICYCHRLTGGTAYTVRYARQQGVPVFNTSSWDLRQLGSK